MSYVAPEEYGLCLQHTLKHLSRLSNTVLSEDACACLATGELPPGMAEPSSEQKQLTEEEHAELASESLELAARLPKINLGTPKRRTGAQFMTLTCIPRIPILYTSSRFCIQAMVTQFMPGLNRLAAHEQSGHPKRRTGAQIVPNFVGPPAFTAESADQMGMQRSIPVCLAPGDGLCSSAWPDGHVHSFRPGTHSLSQGAALFWQR